MSFTKLATGRVKYEVQRGLASDVWPDGTTGPKKFYGGRRAGGREQWPEWQIAPGGGQRGGFADQVQAGRAMELHVVKIDKVLAECRQEQADGSRQAPAQPISLRFTAIKTPFGPIPTFLIIF